MEASLTRIPHSRYSITPPSVIRRRRSEGLVTQIKPVYKLTCKHCHTILSARSMKDILLSNAQIELFSTDTPSESLQILDKDYVTASCYCRIRDVACLKCGCVIGYHVVSPCIQCLESCNNGHFWMFHSNACESSERRVNSKVVTWHHLQRPHLDIEFLRGNQLAYEQLCR
ncbi:hypothetical protein G6F64_005371 [Rhizopus arrhizus]|uniref:Protein FAM72A n=1 Tax=Rhizopus oryzae TaxID=64495 RepID=A0A9P7BTG2_RHIOR|nr:hypothetical protein G6F64_005371 [Rhizopus arrhizus]